MATFGWQTKGAATFALTNYIIGPQYTCIEAGTANSITVYLKISAAGAKIKCAIYKVSDNSLIGYTEEWTITTGWDNWKTLNIVSGGTLAATDYYLVMWCSADITLYYTYDTAYLGKYQSKTYDSFPDPLVPTNWPNNHVSIYCTYTPTPPLIAGGETKKYLVLTL